MARDSLRDAGIYFTQAQQAAPDDPTTNRALGDFYLKRGIGSLAIPSYQKAVELDSVGRRAAVRARPGALLRPAVQRRARALQVGDRPRPRVRPGRAGAGQPLLPLGTRGHEALRRRARAPREVHAARAEGPAGLEPAGPRLLLPQAEGRGRRRDDKAADAGREEQGDVHDPRPVLRGPEELERRPGRPTRRASRTRPTCSRSARCTCSWAPSTRPTRSTAP